MPKAGKPPRIFVLLPSYRDPECRETLEDLFAKAAHPERVFVGLVLQYDKEEDAAYIPESWPQPKQVRVVEFALEECHGAGWARNRAWDLWDGEEYCLQIHSHSRFAEGWDEILLDMLARCPSDKAAITGGPPDYRPGTDVRVEDRPVTRTQIGRMGKEDDPQFVHFYIDNMHPYDPRVGLSQTPLWVGCFLFGPSELFAAFPADEHIYFWGEELVYSARLWTHGWDLFQYDKPVLAHQWNRKETGDKQPYREYKEPRNQKTYHRIRHFLELETSDDEEVTVDLDKYALGDERSLKDFYSFAGIDLKTRTATPAALKGFFRLPVDKEWGRDKIFVSIASYRDPECQHTIADLYKKATHPENIYVGLIHQIDEKEDAACFELTFPYPDQVREQRFHWSQALGVCWARWAAQQLWRGEEYSMQIDSHMRFAEGWDEKMKAELAACPAEKPMLTGCIARYTPPDEIEPNPKPSVLRSGAFSSEGNIRNRGAFLNKTPETPLNGAFISAGYIFAKSDYIEEVPYDPYMYFDQEEITYAARLYTHGWDVFSNREAWIFHYYITLKNAPRRLPWDDAKSDESEQKKYLALRTRGKGRFHHMVGAKPSEDKEIKRNLELFGFGTSRRLMDYENYCGLDLTGLRSSEYAMRARFIHGLETYLGQRIYVPELDDEDKKDARPNLMSEEERLQRLHRRTGTKLRARDSQSRIFVAIASYRDPECQHTVKDLFEKAANAERIFVGICGQYDEKEDADCFEVPYPNPDQVRETRVHYKDAKGMSWARAEAQKLMQDEEYVLHIDSHMRFESGWDHLLIDMLTRHPDPKAAISAFLPAYKPEGTPNMKNAVTRLRIDRLSEPNSPAIIHLAGDIVRSGKDERSGLYATPFMVGNFLFGRSEMFAEVPIDPHLYFHGDEASYSARLWTHGYTIYQPDINLAYHQWTRPAMKDKQDYKKINDERARLTAERVFHLLGIKSTTHDEALQHLPFYGLGAQRSLESFWQFAEIDLAARQVSENAKKGIWVQPNPPDDYQHLLQEARIFVSIASYRDPECRRTVNDLFARAAHPERVTVGVAWQFRDGEDRDCFKEAYIRPDQVRERRFRPEESRGVSWARQQAFTLLRGEEYTLQIDSHMRFEDGWDVALLDMLMRAPAKKPVISAFLPAYKPSGGGRQLMDGKLPRLKIAEVIADDAAQIQITGMSVEGEAALAPTPVVLCHFLFARTQFFNEIANDPRLPYKGDDLTVSARLWTHGYRAFQPDKNIAWHAWERERPGAPYMDRRSPQTLLARERVRHLLGLELSENESALAELERYGHGELESLEGFFDYLGVDFNSGDISEAAANGRWTLPEEKAGEAATPRIFVSIASYRDPECQHTVADLFEKASHPERIYVGLCWQFIEEEDADFFEVPYPYPDQVRVLEIDARESKGACWARSKVQELWQGEEYHLQIDSHMRFEQGWDDTLITMHKQAEQESPKAVLTTYPAGYLPPNDVKNRMSLRLVAKEFDKAGIFTMTSRSVPRPPAPTPVKGAFMGACMFFGRGNIIKDVPYDPYLYFFGEEITLSVRFWTKGYDIYHPQYPVMYHCWERTGRRTHFEDHRDWSELNQRSYERVHYMLEGKEPKDEIVKKEIDKYGLGKERSLHQYQLFSGVHFAKRLVLPGAYEGIFPAVDEKGEAIVPPNFKIPANHPRANEPDTLNEPNNPKEPTMANPPADNRKKPPVIVKHQPAASGPVKVLEHESCVVYDNFLPEDVYERLFDQCALIDYQRINSQGKVRRVWDLTNGFPLRSEKNVFYYPEGHTPGDGRWTYPTKTDFDPFVDGINRIMPQASQKVGHPGKGGWDHFSVTSWIYPQGTGLSLHDDGSGVYTGAYVYFMSPVWKPHWGGLLLVLDDTSNDAIQTRKHQGNPYQFHQKKWLYATEHEDIAMETGLAHCIMPKRNRIVFIAPDAFHMVTHVLPAAGENVRMSLAGFFHRYRDKKKEDEVKKAEGR